LWKVSVATAKSSRPSFTQAQSTWTKR